MPSPVDLRESFPTTEDAITGEGVPLTKSLEGDVASGKIGSVGFAFKNASGNLTLPQLDVQGRLPISSEIQGTRLRAKGTTAGSILNGSGSSYTNMTVVLSIPITNSVTGRMVGDMKGAVSCRRASLFQMVYQDTLNEVVLTEAILDSGQYTHPIGIDGDEFDIPASASSPAFIIRAGNFDKASDLHASLKVVQF